jgi:hypothetical protein
VWAYPRGEAVQAKGGRDSLWAVDYAARTDFWLPPAEREARAQAYVRLVSELRTREGVRIPSDHQPPIRTIEDWKRHHRTVRTEKSPVRSRVWRFEFHWGGETQTVVLELPEK